MSTHATVDSPRSGSSDFNRSRTAPAGGDTLNFRRIVTGGEPRWTWEARYVRSIVIIDFIVGIVAATAVLAIHFGFDDMAHHPKYAVISASVPLVWIGTLAMARTYETRNLFEGSEEYQRVFRAALLLVVGVGLTAYFFNERVPRSYPLMTVAFLAILSIFGRYGRRHRLHLARRDGSCVRRVLLLGHADRVSNLTERLRKEYHYGLKVVGICLPTDQLSMMSRVGDSAVLGDFTHASAAARAISADTVIVMSCPELDGAGLRRLAWSLERDDIDLIVASSLIDVGDDRITIRPVDGLPMMHVEHPRLSGLSRAIKVVFDVAVAALLAALMSPVLLVLAVMVRLDSPGPALFRQTRVGKNGREFTILKFRTMYSDAEQRREALLAYSDTEGVLFKMRDDPRVTRIGRILRRLSLDELPQLLNVLRGNMSLVGPRPPLPGEVAAYPDDMRRRLVVKPGMTGLWQISGRSDLTSDDAVRLDLQYVENWSLSLDLVIMCRTATAVLRSSGAY